MNPDFEKQLNRRNLDVQALEPGVLLRARAAYRFDPADEYGNAVPTVPSPNGSEYISTGDLIVYLCTGEKCFPLGPRARHCFFLTSTGAAVSCGERLFKEFSWCFEVAHA